MSRDKHGRLSRINFTYGDAQVTISYEDVRTAKLTALYSENRGKGEATAVMLEAMSFADKHGTALWLEVQRYGNWRNSLDNKQLITFYERFGFDLVADESQPKRMTREPLLKGDEA